jgi:peroxiredoxin Q/BCP
MVSVDTLEDNKAFAEKEQANFPMLADPEKKVADAYGVLPPVNPDRPDAPRLAKRWMFFIGPDGKIMHIEKVGHTADAGEYLSKTLAELGVKKK